MYSNDCYSLGYVIQLNYEGIKCHIVRFYTRLKMVNLRI